MIKIFAKGNSSRLDKVDGLKKACKIEKIVR